MGCVSCSVDRVKLVLSIAWGIYAQENIALVVALRYFSAEDPRPPTENVERDWFSNC